MTCPYCAVEMRQVEQDYWVCDDCDELCCTCIYFGDDGCKCDCHGDESDDEVEITKDDIDEIYMKTDTIDVLMKCINEDNWVLPLQERRALTRWMMDNCDDTEEHVSQRCFEDDDEELILHYVERCKEVSMSRGGKDSNLTGTP